MKTSIGILITVLLLSATAAAQQPFDHHSTGFDLDGAHQNVSCDRCHAGGIFEGTNPTCVSCHSQSGTVLSAM